MVYKTDEKPDILLVTVTQVEQDAVLRNFKTVGGESVQKGPYLDLGIINDARVWMAISGMGSEGITGSALTMQKAIDETSPKVIIMVGIAFGVNEQKQQIGDILVSEFIVPYESQRVGKSGTDLRGARPPASPELVPIFKISAAKWRENEKVRVEFGPILSGNKLIDNLDFRDRLVKASGAIGGEMEGAGLCFVASAKKVDWILIKGICDWADGNKSQDKENRQALAAENAARFTLYVLSNSLLVQPVSDIFEQAGKLSDRALIAKVPVEKETLRNDISKIRNKLSSTNYKDAASVGKIISEQINGQFEHDNPEMELILGEFWVYYALALIYSEGASNGIFASLERIIARLEDRKQLYLSQDVSNRRRFYLILGRAYNHLGYSYWMDKGHYVAALEKFDKAKEYFISGVHHQELATTYDNLARVYAQLGFRAQAEYLCAHSMWMRSEAFKQNDNYENRYRLALSLNSSAIIQLLYGHSLRARLESERALTHFQECVPGKGERGKGLAFITQGNAFRVLGSHWQYASNTPSSISSSKEYLRQACDSLMDAEKIFIRVDEDVRLLQIYNELGCVYREFYALYKKNGLYDEADDSKVKAQNYFDKIVGATENARKYPLIFIDTCHDLAQTLYSAYNDPAQSMSRKERASQEDEILKYLEMAEYHVPAEYKLGANYQKIEISPAECVEEYWHNLGKICVLKGDLVYGEIPEPRKSNRIQSVRRERIFQAFEAYFLAAGYFSHYLGYHLTWDNAGIIQEMWELEKHFQYSHNIYQRLSKLPSEDIRFVKSDVYEQVIETYNLESSWIDHFFKQPFDLLLRNSDTAI